MNIDCFGIPLFWIYSFIVSLSSTVVDTCASSRCDSSHWLLTLCLLPIFPESPVHALLSIVKFSIPVTIIVSFLSLFGWLVCYYTVHFLLGWLPTGLLRYVAGIPILLGSLWVAVMVTAVIIKPLRPLFKKTEQHTPKQILGQTVIVRTSRVDSEFGEAELDDGGAGLILRIRADKDQTFTRGDRVVLLQYLETENIYRVVSEEEFRG